MKIAYTGRTLGSWAVPLPLVIERLEAAAARAIADPSPANVEDFDALAFIAEQKAKGGTFGNPVGLRQDLLAG